MEITTLSEAAMSLLRLHAERRGDIAVDESTREPYRELAGAGLMVAGHSFTRGREAFYRMTKAGYDFVTASSHAESASPRR
jgi:hypothetical protein